MKMQKNKLYIPLLFHLSRELGPAAGLQPAGSSPCAGAASTGSSFLWLPSPGGGASQGWEQDCLGPRRVGTGTLRVLCVPGQASATCSPHCSLSSPRVSPASRLPPMRPELELPTPPRSPPSTDLQRLVHFSVGKLRHTRARALPKVEPRVKAKPGRGPRFPGAGTMFFPRVAHARGLFLPSPSAS